MRQMIRSFFVSSGFAALLLACSPVTMPAPSSPAEVPITLVTPPIAESTSTLDPQVLPLADTATVYEASVTLPTYPFERYQTDAVDPRYQWPFKRFDIERFRAEAPPPAPRSYRLLVLENAYLRVLLLPELGGRVWQVIHKPSGKPMFYQNTVVKPTHWGLADQRGWLALGGLEWGLPVIEHGYDWGVPWRYELVQENGDVAKVIVRTPDDGRLLQAQITVALRAEEARFTVEPYLLNVSTGPLAFSFWIDAMLAPGSGERPSEQLRFVLPAAQVTVHSTADQALPPPRLPFPWPEYKGRDLSQLGTWQEYLGFFESPAAHGPFVGVYDPAYDTGVVRAFPADVVRGSKVFALGWRNALSPDNYTDDDSAYVELHGGLARSFFEQTTLAAGDHVTWRETWYPIDRLGGLTAADADAALSVTRTSTATQLVLYAPCTLTGTLVLTQAGQEQMRWPVRMTPATVLRQRWTRPATGGTPIVVRLLDSRGQIVLEQAIE
jgi:hypothetical protein